MAKKAFDLSCMMYDVASVGLVFNCRLLYARVDLEMKMLV